MLDYESKRRLIIFGDSACGKTLSLATVPGSLHVIDFDRQLKSLVEEWKRLKRPAKDLSWTTVNTMQKPAGAFREAKDALFHSPPGFDFYALDSYTTFGIVATHFTVGIGERNYNQSTNTDLMGYVVDYFWQFANEVEARGAWLIVIMHEKWLEIKDGQSDPNDWRSKRERIGPDVASSAKITIPAQCDFVFHMEKSRKAIRGEARSVSRFRTRGTPFIMAKAVGYEEVLDDVEDANIAQIISKIGLPPKGIAPKGDPKGGSKKKTTQKKKEKESKWLN